MILCSLPQSGGQRKTAGNGRQADGRETGTAAGRAFGRGPGAPRGDRRQSAEPAEARRAGPHRSGAGPQAGGDHAADGHVQADGSALVGPLPRAAGKPGMARSTVRGLLKAGGLRPHRVRTARVPRDPGSGLKVRDAVGLHVDPPDYAVVIPVDGKTRIQALGRTRRPLPMRPGHARTGTHACRRNGTTCLLAALDVSTGRVVGHHRPVEFPAFPDHVAEGIGPGTPARAIPGNVPSHRPAGVRGWLKGRPDRTFHLTPTPASWTDAVEEFFPGLSRQRLEDAVLDPPAGYVSAIEGYIAHHNANDARPFRWSRRPEDPVAVWKRGHRRLREMASDE